MNKRKEIYHMTEKEMARLKVANKLMEKAITVKKAALYLRIICQADLKD